MILFQKGLKLAQLASALAFLKTSLQNPFLLRQLEIILNKLIAEQPLTHSHLEILHGNAINITLKGFKIEWHLLVMQQQILISPGLHPTATVNIQIDTLALPGYIVNKDNPKPVGLQGDFRVILELQNFVSRLELDLYPLLIRLLGTQAATVVIEIKIIIADQLSRIRNQLGTIRDQPTHLINPQL